MKGAIEKSPMYLQTCNNNGYSTLKICLAKPYGNSNVWRGGRSKSMINIF